jgi:hypothetical protein
MEGTRRRTEVDFVLDRRLRLELDGNDPDNQMFPSWASSDRVHTIGDVATETTPAYFWQGGKFNLSLFDKVGQLAPFSDVVDG